MFPRLTVFVNTWLLVSVSVPGRKTSEAETRTTSCWPAHTSNGWNEPGGLAPSVSNGCPGPAV